VAGRQSSPFTGKLSARPAGKPGNYFIVKENDPFRATAFPLQRNILRRSVCVFQAWRNLSLRCGSTKTKPWGGTVPPPDGRPRAQVKERVGRTTPFSSSAMSSDRLFLDRVARQQSPSPLHRQPQNNMHSAEPRAKGDISTLPGRGHFYFALTCNTFCLTTAYPIVTILLSALHAISSDIACLPERRPGSRFELTPHFHVMASAVACPYEPGHPQKQNDQLSPLA
jgi:hypothetical protein